MNDTKFVSPPTATIKLLFSLIYWFFLAPCTAVVGQSSQVKMETIKSKCPECFYMLFIWPKIFTQEVHYYQEYITEKNLQLFFLIVFTG